MKLAFLSMGVAALCGAAVAGTTPTLDGTTAIGIGGGAERYHGSYGHNVTPYFRAYLDHHFTEWLGFRAIGGFGNASDGTHEFRTEWYSNIGLQAVIQPKIDALGSFRPYLASGASTDFGTAKHNGEFAKDLDWNWYWPIEAGVEWLATDYLGIHGWIEERIHSVQWDKLDGTRTPGSYWDKRDDMPRVGLGISLRFGGYTPAPKPAPVVEKVVSAPTDADKDGVADDADKCANTPAGVKVDNHGCPVDADGDNIPDYLDRCANTPKGAQVDAHGCPVDGDKDGVADYADKCANTPAGVKVDNQGCPVDADKDGVADYKDKCANTPAGVKVDSVGCPVDADADGVPDYLDRCANTAKGVKVDSTGCVEIKVVKGTKLTLDGIVFDEGKASIDSSSAPTLQHAAEAIKKAPKAKIEIAGFTDNTGKAKVNKALSAKRANAVKAYLVKLGVPAKQITAKGYGPAQPKADNKTEEGRAQNRRIEFCVK